MDYRKPYTKKQSAFTLIELLVVIAIISILAAILFPVFASAREKARQTACLSNEKQFALGFIQYSSDYDETMPCGGPLYTMPGRGWFSQVYPYIKSMGVMICPSDPNAKISKGGSYAGWSYAYNADLAGKNNPKTHSTVDLATGNVENVGNAAILSEMTSPAKTVVTFEITEVLESHAENPPVDLNDGSIAGTGWPAAGGFDSTHQFQDTGELRGDADAVPSSTMLHAYGRHTGGANYAMADGHAKWFRPENVSEGQWATSPTYCQPATPPSTYTSDGTACTDATIYATFSPI